MLALRSFFIIVHWDVIRELRRRESALNMILFAVLVLFIASYGLPEESQIKAEVGPLFLWISVLFAGTVGLSRAFSVEREEGAMTGVLVSPVDPGMFYLAKAASTWLYVMAMGTLVAASYVVLFNFTLWERLPLLFATLAAFSFAYVAAGTVIAAMTSSLRGGEVVLRILLIPILMPVITVTLKTSERIFPALPAPSAPPAPRTLAVLLSLGTIYLVLGYLLFPKVVEE